MNCYFIKAVVIGQLFCWSVCAQNTSEQSGVRMWKDRSGREITASFLYLEDGRVGLQLESGREAVVSFETLSGVDQKFATQQSEADFLPVVAKPMPEQVSLKPTTVAVSGGPKRYETKWFEFESEKSVSKAFVDRAALVFELTRQAVASLPLGIAATPPKGQRKFMAKFVTQASFGKVLESTPNIGSPDKIAAFYDPLKKCITVPYDQLGASLTDRGNYGIAESSDFSTLIHEISHQVMHDHLPLSPIWFCEGFAEYMAAIPYRDGVLDFSSKTSGLKARLKNRYGSLTVELPGLKSLLKRQRGDWQGGREEYVSSLIYTYYFMHLDQPEMPGARLAGFMYLLHQAKNDTQLQINDYNDTVADYNKRVVDYNVEIELFRNQFKAYQNSVRHYNLKVDDYNQQLENQGVPKVFLGKQPSAPKMPVEPVMPEILKNRQFHSPVNIFRIANDKAHESLLMGRTYSQIETNIKIQFAEIGIQIEFD